MMIMRLPLAAVCISLILVMLITGCTIPESPETPGESTTITRPASTLPVSPTIFPNSSIITPPNASPVPLLLKDSDWQTASGCGWTQDAIPESAALLTGNCQVRQLVGDGWEIVGIGYEMNFIGSRCRKTTHPDVSDSCDWCLDAGPTLRLQYKGIMTSDFMANLPERKVTMFKTSAPMGVWSGGSPDGSQVYTFENGTVLYRFRRC